MMQAERHLERLFTVVEVIFHNKIALVVIFITTGAIHHAGIRERQMAAHAGEIIGKCARCGGPICNLATINCPPGTIRGSTIIGSQCENYACNPGYVDPHNK